MARRGRPANPDNEKSKDYKFTIHFPINFRKIAREHENFTQFVIMAVIEKLVREGYYNSEAEIRAEYYTYRAELMKRKSDEILRGN